MRLPAKNACHSLGRNLQIHPVSGQLVKIISVAAKPGDKEKKENIHPEAVPRLTNLCLGFDEQEEEAWAQPCNDLQVCCEHMGGHSWLDGQGNRHDC